MTPQRDAYERTEVRDGMRITWNAPIRMNDGVTLRADVFRPVDEAAASPVIISHGVYAKGLSYQEGYPLQWQKMVGRPPGHPGRIDQQVPELGSDRPRALGAARLRRRAGRFARLRLERGHPRSDDGAGDDDFCQCIEWAAAQPWSNGVVGVLGISYYANMAWRVAQRMPRGLKAIIPWEGFVDSTATPATTAAS